jgi:hypothetical protein
MKQANEELHSSNGKKTGIIEEMTKKKKKSLERGKELDTVVCLRRLRQEDCLSPRVQGQLVQYSVNRPHFLKKKKKEKKEVKCLFT